MRENPWSQSLIRVLWRAPNVPGPRERTYRGYLLRENPWLQLQGMQHVCVGRANKSRLRCARQLSDKRKFDPERRPAVIPIFGPYQSIVRFDNGARDGQPHAHAFRLARKPPMGAFATVPALALSEAIWKHACAGDEGSHARGGQGGSRGGSMTKMAPVVILRP